MSAVLQINQSASEPTEETLSTEEAVWECFTTAAVGSTCRIPDLLRETRQQGIDDSDVLKVISESETYSSIECRGSEKHYRTCYSANGLFYVESDEFNGDSRMASIFEAFAATESSDDENNGERSQGYVLSDDLQEQGCDVTGVESIVLKAAQTAHRRFKDGSLVSVRIIKRICREYHTEAFREVKIQEVIDGLVERGICHCQGTKLGLVTGKQKELDSVCTLTTDPIEQQVLRAANDSIDWFKSRNVAPMKGVFSITHLRCNLHRDEFQYAIIRLVTRGILEQVPSKGTMGLRLTKQAEEQLS